MSEPKRKRVRTPAVKRDPVIGALIAKLPGEGAAFDRAQRINWLRQMAMAMDGAYGVDAAISIDSVALPASPRGAPEMSNAAVPAARPMPIAGPAEPDEIRYFVDKQGFARMEPGGKKIRPVDIPAGAELEDEREGDNELDSIKWADGVWPPGAYPNPLTIVKA